jgi:hypothetical protein
MFYPQTFAGSLQEYYLSQQKPPYVCGYYLSLFTKNYKSSIINTMDDARKELMWVIFLLIFLAIAWYVSGGYSRYSPVGSGPFLKSPTETHQEELRKQTEQVISGGGASEETAKQQTNESVYKYEAELSVGSGAKKSNLQEEYVEIRASLKNTKPLLISEWFLKGKKGLDIKLGKGAYLPYSAQVNLQEPIFLQPGEKAIVVTGVSPIGTSFRLNKCTGYFEQFQDFIPSLPKQCPYPEDEDLPANLNDNCLDYIEKLPRCEAHIKAIPPGLSASCQNYINEKINYNTCVEIHKNDSDFYKLEWRIYLGRSEELWKNKRETITLYDENGKIVDWRAY